MNTDRQQEILDEVIVLQHDDRTNRKKMTFAQAWSEVQKQRPDLFSDSPFVKELAKARGIHIGTPECARLYQLHERAKAARERARNRVDVISASRPSDEVTVECLGGWSIWA
jgi:hypothetical protein